MRDENIVGLFEREVAVASLAQISPEAHNGPPSCPREFQNGVSVLSSY
jgi:hypothetical protein